MSIPEVTGWYDEKKNEEEEPQACLWTETKMKSELKLMSELATDQHDMHDRFQKIMKTVPSKKAKVWGRWLKEQWGYRSVGYPVDVKIWESIGGRMKKGRSGKGGNSSQNQDPGTTTTTENGNGALQLPTGWAWEDVLVKEDMERTVRAIAQKSAVLVADCERYQKGKVLAELIGKTTSNKAALQKMARETKGLGDAPLPNMQTSKQKLADFVVCSFLFAQGTAPANSTIWELYNLKEEDLPNLCLP